jgi:hypothetical protein
LRPADGAGRLLARQFVEGSLFNLKEKSSCRFSADAGREIAPCNSWLIIEKRRADRQRRGGNRSTAEERGWPSHARCTDMRVGLARPQMAPWPRRRRRAIRPLVGRPVREVRRDK